MRLIDADALKKDVNGISTHWLNDWSTIGVLSIIDKQPTVSPDMAQVLAYECGKAEQKRGRWMRITDEVFADRFECSECGKLPPIENFEWWLSDYCPNCGADMRGESNE